MTMGETSLRRGRRVLDDLDIKEGVTIPGYELWFTATRSGGPGGQHANKTSSAVTIHWVPSHSGVFDVQTKQHLVSRLANRLTNEGELQISSREERSQHRNRDIARQRMAEVIARALKPKKRRKRTRPPSYVHKRRVENKRRRSEIKKMRKDPSTKDY